MKNKLLTILRSFAVLGAFSGAVFATAVFAAGPSYSIDLDGGYPSVFY